MIDLTITKDDEHEGYHQIGMVERGDMEGFFVLCTLDEIEDLELNLTDIIKKLQDYRMKQNHD